MLLKTNGSQRSSVEIAEEEESALVCSDDDGFNEGTASPPPTDRHIVRSQGDLTDRYHGPCTLFALCSQFSDTALVEQDGSIATHDTVHSDHSLKNEALKDILTRMCLEASLEEPFDIKADHTTIRLPPKQFLMMVQAQFFQRTDYATDLFVQSHFCSVVEEIYSRPFTHNDEA